MGENPTKTYKEAKNKGFKTEGDNLIPEPIYDFTKPEGQVKAAGPRDMEEDSNNVINEHYPSESIIKEGNSMKKNEAKLRTTSDKEC
jgi:hypothetical protein